MSAHRAQARPAKAARPPCHGRSARPKLFHDPVFERMKCHDGETPTGLENALGRGKRTHQFAQLVIDSNAQGLKAARGRMDFIHPHRLDAGDEIAQFALSS